MILLHIIYHCVGGSHSSCTAAAIHLNMLPINNTPSKYALLNIPFFDTLEKTDLGKIIYRGTDKLGNKVYTLGRQFSPHIIIPIIKDLWKILGQNEKDILIINTLPCVNFLMRLGGFSSRRLKWVKFGRPIVTHGTLLAYKNIAQIVNNTKKLL